nr:amiloride-sensitive sodium channel subunit alpha-like [Lytechinus pictus]
MKGREKDTLGKSLTDFGNETTIHGIQYVINKENIPYRFCWLLICIGFSVVFIIQGVAIINDFLTWPYSTKIDIVGRPSLTFPAVTVCNANMMRRSRLVDTRFEGLIALDGGISGADYDYSWWFSSDFVNAYQGSESSLNRKKRSPPESINYDTFSWYNPSADSDFQYYADNWDAVSDENDWLGFYRASRADDYSDFVDVVNPSQSELSDYGHQLEDFVLQCTFDRRQCNISQDFYVWQNRYFGNCFTFNSALSPANLTRTTGKTGGLSGLHLTLFVEQPEYMGILSPHTGAKVSIHHPDVFPFPEDDALELSTGQETSIGIRQEYIKRLGGYYTNCTLDGGETNFTSSDYTYSLSACKKMCYQRHLHQFCGCVDNQFFDTNQIPCDVLNATQQWCRQYVEERYLDDDLACVCPSPCTETKYIKSASSLLWPSERYEEHLLRRLNASSNSNAVRILSSSVLSSKNLIRIKIFYEDLNYEFVEMVPVYTIPSVLGSVGGLMGLYIGMSFISVFEVLFLLLRMCKIGVSKLFFRDQVHPLKT